jgi:hypothetical protein
MNKYFILTEEDYEACREEMDNISGYPNSSATTWFIPASGAFRDFNNNCLLACNEIIANFIISKYSYQIINKEQFEILLPVIGLSGIS